MSSRLWKKTPVKSVRHRGVALLGYALTAALISIAAILGMSELGRNLGNCIFPAVASALKGEQIYCVSSDHGTPGEPGETDEPEEEDNPEIAFSSVEGIDPGEQVISAPAIAKGFSGSRPATVSGPPGANPQF